PWKSRAMAIEALPALRHPTHVAQDRVDTGSCQAGMQVGAWECGQGTHKAVSEGQGYRHSRACLAWSDYFTSGRPGTSLLSCRHRRAQPALCLHLGAAVAARWSGGASGHTRPWQGPKAVSLGRERTSLAGGIFRPAHASLLREVVCCPTTSEGTPRGTGVATSGTWWDHCETT